MFKYWEVSKELPNEENKKVINEFLLSLKNRDEHKSTINYFRLTLQSFFKEKRDLFSSLTFKAFEQWLLDYQKGRTDETVNKLLEVLRSFYSFCKDKGYLEKSPIREEGVKYWELKIQLPNEENEHVINEFLVNLKDLNFSRSTIIRIRDHLQMVFKKIEEPFTSHTSKNTKQWIKEMQKYLKENTVEGYLSNLRSFYNYCTEKGYIDVNPIIYSRKKAGEYWKVTTPVLNKENKERINEFLLSLYSMNYSKLTILSYRTILQNFFKKEKKVYSSISSEEIHEWVTQLSTKVKEGTLKFRLNVLNSFYTFCVEEKYIEKSPVKRRWFPRLPKPIPKFLNKGEVVSIRKQCESEPLRNRALVEFMLTSGCRVREVYMLDRCDVDLENRTAMVTGKGKKIRQIYFSVKSSLLLERYLETRKDNNPALFVTHQFYPKRLSIKSMRTVVARIGLKTELQGKLHPHRFRHTFATNLLEKGADISFIGDLLGHSNLNTTKIYSNLPKQKIISLYRKYMG
ncbi:tyrosine-type recombinase/integrase [Fictibacillus sp. NPDC058756]|uniref:tyrosine-type recombinase/integrase n=1 Tax=Fictibacillus sp. NPDC058756 TaxID=3346625 RepID=UPI0036BBB192